MRGLMAVRPMICIRTAALVALLLTATPLHAGSSSITYSVGAWPYQDGLVVTDFHVDVSDQHLNLFKSEASVRVRITGTVTYARAIGGQPCGRPMSVSGSSRLLLPLVA